MMKLVGELIQEKIPKQFQKQVRDDVFSEFALSAFFEKYGPETDEYKSGVVYLKSINVTYILHPGALIAENTRDDNREGKNSSNTQSERVFSQQDSGIQNVRMVYPSGGDPVECVALILTEQRQVVIEPIIPNRAAYII